MTCGAWPVTGAPVMNRAEETRRRGDTAAARVLLANGPSAGGIPP